MRSHSQKQLACPYNQKHVMPENRLQWHLTKCPDRQKQQGRFSICPYNAMHHIPNYQFENHKENCPDRPEDAPEIKQKQEWVTTNPQGYKPYWQDSLQRVVQEQVKEDPNDIHIPEPSGPMKSFHPSPPQYQNRFLPKQQVQKPEVKEMTQNNQDDWVHVQSKSRQKKKAPNLRQDRKEVNMWQNRGQQQVVYSSFAEYQSSFDVTKKRKNLKKELKQIEKLEMRQRSGEVLEQSLINKINKKAKVEHDLRALQI